MNGSDSRVAENDVPDGVSGRYRLISHLGSGATYHLFVANDMQLGRDVALKVMKPDAAKLESKRKMFLRQARSAASTRHNRIVTILDAGETDGIPYITEELLAGERLDQYLRRTPCLPLADALAIATQVADGLNAAHAIGVLRRELKPVNVWLSKTEWGESIDVRILDFDLGWAAKGTLDDDFSYWMYLVTELYTAPELQMGTSVVGPQSHLFSLGVMLYQMLTGRMPFGGSSGEALFANPASSSMPEPPAALVPTIPAAVSDFVLRMIAKDPKDRVSSAEEVIRELTRLQTTESQIGLTQLPDIDLALSQRGR